jgi:hypothetical protein
MSYHTLDVAELLDDDSKFLSSPSISQSERAAAQRLLAKSARRAETRQVRESARAIRREREVVSATVDRIVSESSRSSDLETRQAEHAAATAEREFVLLNDMLSDARQAVDSVAVSNQTRAFSVADSRESLLAAISSHEEAQKVAAAEAEAQYHRRIAQRREAMLLQAEQRRAEMAEVAETKLRSRVSSLFADQLAEFELGFSTLDEIASSSAATEDPLPPFDQDGFISAAAGTIDAALAERMASLRALQAAAAVLAEDSQRREQLQPRCIAARDSFVKLHTQRLRSAVRPVVKDLLQQRFAACKSVLADVLVDTIVSSMVASGLNPCVADLPYPDSSHSFLQDSALSLLTRANVLVAPLAAVLAQVPCPSADDGNFFSFRAPDAPKEVLSVLSLPPVAVPLLSASDHAVIVDKLRGDLVESLSASYVSLLAGDAHRQAGRALRKLHRQYEAAVKLAPPPATLPPPVSVSPPVVEAKPEPATPSVERAVRPVSRPTPSPPETIAAATLRPEEAAVAPASTNPSTISPAAHHEHPPADDQSAVAAAAPSAEQPPKQEVVSAPSVSPSSQLLPDVSVSPVESPASPPAPVLPEEVVVDKSESAVSISAPVARVEALRYRALLLRGAVFKKHGKRGKPNERFVGMRDDFGAICYRDPAKSKWKEEIDKSSITEVVAGASTKVFTRSKVDETRCFSVISDDRTLDLELLPNSNEDRDLWVAAIRWWATQH